MIKRTVQLTEIDETLEVLKPIQIAIEEYDDEVFANVDEAGVYGAGVNEADAILDLRNEIKTVFSDLNNADDDNLGKLPLDWKRYLNAMIKVRE